MILKMKKSISVMASLGIILTMFAGCGAAKDNKNEKSSDKSVQSAQEPVKIDWLAYQTIAQPDPNSEICKLVESKYNVKFNFWFVDDQKWDDVLNVKLASGDMPDVMLIKNRSNISKYVAQGVLSEIPVENIKKYAPNYMKALEKYDPQGAALNVTKIDGKNYGFTSMNVDGSYPFAIVWRTDWLKNVGITKTPESLQDFETAMYKFRNEDPDKNGKKDTYGLSNTTLALVFGAYGIIEPVSVSGPTAGTAATLAVTLKDNKIVYAATQPEAKQALTVLQKWYKDGVIDPEFVTGENTGGYWANSQAFFNNKVGVTGKINYYHYAPPLSEGDLGGSCYQEMKKANPNSTFDIGKAPIGPDGKSGGPKVGIINASYGVTTKSKDPRVAEVALKMFDATFNESEMDYLTTNIFGKKDVDYTINKDGVYNSLIKEAKVQREKGMGVFVYGTLGPDISKKFSPVRYAYADEKCNYPGYVGPMVPSTEQSSKNGQTLAKLAAEAYIKIISGDKPISYFDDFVKQFNAAGGTETEKAMTEAYNKMLGK